MDHRATIQYDHPIRGKSAQDFLDDFLIKRKSQIGRGPSLKTKDRITQRGVWYRIRPVMISEGFEPKENWGTTARYIASIITERCEKLFEAITGHLIPTTTQIPLPSSSFSSCSNF
jgi:hypothetical protein